jgi:hypothetical protein
MAPRDEGGSTLSAHRAFVVHLGTGGGAGRRRFSGRVEHLSSGESMHFSSLRGLLAFFAAALDAAAVVAPSARRSSGGPVMTSPQAARPQPPAFRDARSVLPRLDAAQPSRPHSSGALQQHGQENRS